MAKINRREVKLCECGCGQPVKWSIQNKCWNRFINGHQMIGILRSKETCEKIRIANTGKNFSEETKKKMSIAKIGTTRSEETNKKNSDLRIEYWKSLENRNYQSKKQKEFWSNPENKEKQIKAQKRGLLISPNKPETIILNLLNENYPNEWKYTGDFSFIINGKSPDFTNINGQKKLIELFGDYWHKGQNPQDRIDIFKPFGYDTLVIWECELKDIDKVKDRINDFVG